MPADLPDRDAAGEPRARAVPTAFLRSFSAFGLMLGTLFFAASLTPSLVPRAPVVQGMLGGLCLAAGYGIGVLVRAVWVALELPVLTGRARRLADAAAMLGCAAAAGLALWWAAGWQNRLRALMDMEPIDSADPFTVAALALLVFGLLVLTARLFGGIRRRLSRLFAHVLPRPQAALVALLATAILFWSIGNGLLVTGVMRTLDRIYAELDARFEEDSPEPADPLKTGGPGSLLTWEGLGRAGRETIAAGPDAVEIAAMTGAAGSGLPVREPLRVYVGLNSAEDPATRAELALAELIRIGAFERSNLVIVTPTGTGWIDPEGRRAMEYVLRGDVASVSVQYSYLASWIALLAAPDYGAETAREVFAAVYGHWTSLPRDRRPRLYLNGLSLGAFNSDLSHDLHQVIGDPYAGALWSGPPFNSRTWKGVAAARNPDTPVWAPQFRDGSVIRFTTQQNRLAEARAPWGPYRVVFLQYPSDAITFYDPSSLWRKPEWMKPPLGPDVSPDLVWIPVVTFLQLTFDLMLAVTPPKGHGHVYAFEHYLDAWAGLTEAPGWTPEALEAVKAAVAAGRG
ncbi:alpha/beta-hydrolase family protein [Cereibacter sphaeroides]|uniref:alpha/beta hydrolase n=1 Tax=Cereibacter sphaeroides TaxID=1063 RepID=UPI001F2C813B|nr:alpha/beta-hydrolase family protein [Cereibacter sphaeroides]MCE6959150.1 alpha/beta-hydrolase family protein [Cereibacter sphaeroides]MCE6968391.1 alpha/beta-hydrolase family protein [Cereibacter sphaeroides]MCE6974189.1 alpha/beta-hydrolase family protein [Cereibacter sphaeroides]